MKKRLLVLLLVVALAVTVSVFTASADNEIDYKTAFDFNPAEATTCPLCEGPVEWVELTGTPAAPAAGEHLHYYLTQATTFTGQIKSTGTLCIHLNGQTLNRAYYSAIALSTGTINIMDGYNQSGKISGGEGISATGTGTRLAPFQISSGELNVYNAELANNQPTYVCNYDSTTAYIGGLVSMKGGSVNLYGNTILQKGASHFGGNVHMHAGSFTMNDESVIADGVASSDGNACKGANVRMLGGSFTMNDDAQILGGKAEAKSQTTRGGSIYIGGEATFTMNGGTISGGHATTKDTATTAVVGVGGNVYVDTNATFTMNDGTVSGGKVTENTSATGVYPNGGNFYVAGTLIVNDGEITGGDATWLGGNIILAAASSDVQLYGGEISGGKASVGGNVGMNNGTLLMEGVTVKNGLVRTASASWNCGPNFYIANGTATIEEGTQLLIEATHTGANALYGGNVIVQAGTVNMNDGLISGGKATRGGAVAVAHPGTDNTTGSGAFNFNGGTITGGTATNDGGNVYIRGTGVFAIAGEATLENGTGSNAGGNIALYSGSLNINGGTITGGHGEYGGGGIYQTGGAASMTDGTISGNTSNTGTAAKANGGNVLIHSTAATFTMSGGTVAGGFDLQDYTDGNLTLSGDAVIDAPAEIAEVKEGTTRVKNSVLNGLSLQNQKITLGTLGEDFQLRVVTTGPVCDMPAGKSIEDMKAYIKGRYDWGSAIYDNDGVLTTGTTEVHIVAKDKSLAVANINNFVSLADALETIDPETQMIYIKNVNTTDTDNERTNYNYTIDKSVVIDINGVAIDGTFTVTEGKTLTLVDNTADDDLDNGPTSFVTVAGAGNVATQTQQPYYKMNFIVLVDEETGVAVPHSVSMKVNKAYILEGEKGLYYGVEYKMDPILAAEVDQFGQFIYVNENAQYYTLEEDFMGYYADGAAESTGVKITGIVSGAASDAANAGTDIYAYGYISFNNGETIKDTPVSYTMTEIMELAAEQEKADLQDFYDTYATTTGWYLNENMTYFQGTAE